MQINESYQCSRLTKIFKGVDLRTAFIIDRESENLFEMFRFSEEFQNVSVPCVIESGSESDLKIADRISFMKDYFLDQGYDDFDKATESYTIMKNVAEIIIPSQLSENICPVIADIAKVVCLPFDAKKLKEGNNREEYCNQILQVLSKSAINLVFLSNFKVVTAPSFIQQLEKAGIEVVNVHPSVLPELKGARPEHRIINKKEFPNANGCTWHLATAGLDEGAVIANLKVGIPYQDTNDTFEYSDKDKENCNRWHIVQAQSLYTPQILAIFKAFPNSLRTLLYDQEAFAAEGRAGYGETEEYKLSLKEDFLHWAEKNQLLSEVYASDGIEFDSWRAKNVALFDRWFVNDRTPYSRVMFNFEGGLKTAEEILGIPSSVESRKLSTPGSITTFLIPDDRENGAFQYFANILTLLETQKFRINSHRVGFTVSFEGREYKPCTITTAEGLIGDLIAQNFPDLAEIRSIPQNVRITAPRRASNGSVP